MGRNDSRNNIDAVYCNISGMVLRKRQYHARCLVGSDRSGWRLCLEDALPQRLRAIVFGHVLEAT